MKCKPCAGTGIYDQGECNWCGGTGERVSSGCNEMVRPEPALPEDQAFWDWWLNRHHVLPEDKWRGYDQAKEAWSAGVEWCDEQERV